MKLLGHNEEKTNHAVILSFASSIANSLRLTGSNYFRL